MIKVPDPRAFSIWNFVTVLLAYGLGINGCSPPPLVERVHRAPLVSLGLGEVGSIQVEIQSNDMPPAGLVLKYLYAGTTVETALTIPPPHIGNYRLVSIDWRSVELDGGIIFIQVSLGEVGSYKVFEEFHCAAIKLKKGARPIQVFSEACGSTEHTGKPKSPRGYRMGWDEENGLIEIRDDEDGRIVWRGR